MLRLIFYPLLLLGSGAYCLGVKYYNFLYTNKIRKSFQFHFPVICIGNITVGGTGKTPHLFYFLEHFKTYHQAVISRGYKRKKKGDRIISNTIMTAKDIGDEMKLTDMKFPNITKIVATDRMVGITKLKAYEPKIECVWMDDGFQHRNIMPSFNILLANYNILPYDDYYLPLGKLRDSFSSSERADIWIVTNTKSDISKDEVATISKKLKTKKSQEVYFSTIKTGKPYSLHNPKETIDEVKDVVAFAGLANNDIFKNYITRHYTLQYFFSFKDHYHYKRKDLQKIIHQYSSLPSSNKALLTTEKDYSKLVIFNDLFKNIKVYIVPIKVHIMFNKEKDVLQKIKTHISTRLTIQ